MKIALLIARILLGLLFGTGVMAFFMTTPPPMAGLAGQFQDVFFRSHWNQFVGAVECIAGVLLLANRYVPLALTILAGVLVNIFFFHLSMAPQGLAAPIIAAALWFVTALQHRASFVPLFAARPPGDVRAPAAPIAFA